MYVKYLQCNVTTSIINTWSKCIYYDIYTITINNIIESNVVIIIFIIINYLVIIILLSMKKQKNNLKYLIITILFIKSAVFTSPIVKITLLLREKGHNSSFKRTNKRI